MSGRPGARTRGRSLAETSERTRGRTTRLPYFDPTHENGTGYVEVEDAVEADIDDSELAGELSESRQAAVSAAAVVDDLLEGAPVAILRRALSTAKRQISALTAAQAIILGAVDEAIPERGYILPVIPAPQHLGEGPNEEIALLHLSDTQIGKVTRTYNSEIAVARIMEIAEKTTRITDIRRSTAKISEIHLALGGDIVEGETIFSHQAHEIDQSVFDQAILTGPVAVVSLILHLLKHFEHVKVFGVCGNHGRSAPKHSSANPRSNWDRVLYHTVKNILLGSAEYPRTEYAGRLEFEIPDDFYYVDRIYEWGALFVHGDQISGGFGGFPFYGTAKKAWGWIDSIPEEWDGLYFGHFHTYASSTLNHRQWYCNGTTESDNGFAKETMASAGQPVQRLQFFNAQYGMISDNPLYLSDSHRQPQLARRTRA